MGQYYRVVLQSNDEENKIVAMNPRHYANGVKLMEHSYIGNDFMQAVETMIWKHPMFVAWIGDYSDSPYEGPYAWMDRDVFTNLYNGVWGEQGTICLIRPEPSKHLTVCHRKRYLVNHSEGVYLDLGAYIVENQWEETWCKKKHKCCIHPLSLLTACGNDRGGGDYHDEYPDANLCGTWAFALIELTDKRPADYTPIMAHFTEQRRV